eukprot:scaffold33563_cov52-Phaeocystis_antarctica.AAC.1
MGTWRRRAPARRLGRGRVRVRARVRVRVGVRGFHRRRRGSRPQASPRETGPPSSCPPPSAWCNWAPPPCACPAG